MPQLNGLPGQSGVNDWTLAPGQFASTMKVLLPVRQSHLSDKMLSLLSKVVYL